MLLQDVCTMNEDNKKLSIISVLECDELPMNTPFVQRYHNVPFNA